MYLAFFVLFVDESYGPGPDNLLSGMVTQGRHLPIKASSLSRVVSWTLYQSLCLPDMELLMHPIEGLFGGF